MCLIEGNYLVHLEGGSNLGDGIPLFLESVIGLLKKGKGQISSSSME